MPKKRFLTALDKTLGTDVSPLAYLVCVYFMVFSGSFIFFTTSDSVQKTVLAQLGVLGGIVFWAFFLFGASGWLILAMAIKSKLLVSISSMIGFVAWLIAALTYFQGDAEMQGWLAITSCLMFGYFFTAGNIGRLWNYSPESRDHVSNIKLYLSSKGLRTNPGGMSDSSGESGGPGSVQLHGEVQTDTQKA